LNLGSGFCELSVPPGRDAASLFGFRPFEER